ncbi:Flp pilus assembly complex ATPase component TadA [Peptococcaceae bacterium]|nr:Flp pilus assembly complex ATPase component TadA [Peptococcaceae bacterium]
MENNLREQGAFKRKSFLSRKRLGDILVENKLITKEQLERALKNQKKMGKRLGEVLIDAGLVTEEDILSALKLQLGIPQVTLSDKIDVKLIKSIPRQLIKRHKVIPIKKEGNRMIVAMFDPLNVLALNDLKIVTNCEVDPVLASRKEIESVIQKVYSLSFLDEEKESDTAEQESLRADYLDLDFSDEEMEDSLAVKLTNSIIKQAIDESVSDIHIEPAEKEVRVRYRVDGILHEAMSLPKTSQSALTARFKILSNMDIAEKRLPQDGRMNVKHRKQKFDLRVSSLPVIRGEKIVIRVLRSQNVSMLSIKELGFDEFNLKRFTDILKHSYGLVLVTGPTGSGKTTTLYAALQELNSIEKNILTIEDPVEYTFEGINQIQVNVKAGLTFAAGLRSILRQDPDIIMVGEIRDAETAEIAVRAASTGHLVLSSLHTNNAATALIRLIDMGVEPCLVLSAVLGVVSQRLVRVLCPHCKESYHLPSVDPIRDFIGIGSNEDVELYRAVGCDNCRKLGYIGRISIQEVMIISEDIREMIKNKNNAQQIRNKAIEEGMITFKEDGIRKALSGVTTIQEVMRVAYEEFKEDGIRKALSGVTTTQEVMRVAYGKY